MLFFFSHLQQIEEHSSIEIPNIIVWIYFLQLEYFETILNPYFTHAARESLKSLQGVLLEKATESVTESIETPTHSRRTTRGSEDTLSDDRQQGMTVSPDDLIVRILLFGSLSLICFRIRLCLDLGFVEGFRGYIDFFSSKSLFQTQP